MSAPETRYTCCGDVNIAYQVIGEGPLDLVYVMGWVTNLEASWQQPSAAWFFQRLAAFSRLILFDNSRHRPLGPSPHRLPFRH